MSKINSRYKGMTFEYQVRDILKEAGHKTNKLIEVSNQSDLKSVQLKNLLAEAFNATERNLKASNGKDSNDLDINLDLTSSFTSFPFQVECKCQKNPSLKDAYEQAVASLLRTGYNKRILLIHKTTLRQSHPNFTGKTMVTLSMDDFLDLLLESDIYPSEVKKWRNQPQKSKGKQVEKS
jgi:hypothetical protein